MLALSDSRLRFRGLINFRRGRLSLTRIRSNFWLWLSEAKIGDLELAEPNWPGGFSRLAAWLNPASRVEDFSRGLSGFCLLRLCLLQAFLFLLFRQRRSASELQLR